MNRLVLIGNGFDLAHGLKTSYKDFISWYWKERIIKLNKETTNVSEDTLCRLAILQGYAWSIFVHQNINFLTNTEGKDIYQYLKKHPEEFEIKSSEFLYNICVSIETKKWVDVENEYYELLKKYALKDKDDTKVKELNEQLGFLQEKLIEYLRTIGTNRVIKDLHNAITDFFDPADFSTEGKKMALENLGLENTNLEEIQYNFEEQKKLIPERIMLLSFNYTATAKMYGNFNIVFNYIHGELEHPENIIFGYGDELDKDFQGILDRNDNEMLMNVKSIKYVETGHYHKMLEFLMSAPFQVLIMGHSCGNSDRTLLNRVFEHENCVSIKPFYHKWPDGSDNYLELVQNISRNFTNMQLYRDRVVYKERCKTI